MLPEKNIIFKILESNIYKKINKNNIKENKIRLIIFLNQPLTKNNKSITKYSLFEFLLNIFN